MATFHEMTGTDGEPVVRCYVKGAPDVLIDRGGSYRSPDGALVPVTDENRHLALEANDRMANSGQRVMVVAQRDFDPATFRPDGDLLPLVTDLTLLAMVGIVDPPRPEAKAAIAECHSAGIQVRMITGDHAITAAAIAKELGIEGRAMTGTEFAAMSDDELLADLGNIGVVARVSPEDKIRLVQLLKRKGNVVAMTGDGVNDAPALKAADIGVAMGITGTEVSKEAAVMILTDDNFATIVKRRLVRPHALRQPGEVPPVPDVDAGRLHRDLPRGRHLRDRRRRAAEPVADPLAQHGRRHPHRHRPRGSTSPPRPDVPAASPGRGTRPVPAELDPDLHPRGRHDGRLAGGLPDRARPGRRRRRATMLLTTLSLYHVVAGCCPATRSTRSSTATPSRPRPSSAGTPSLSWPSSPSPRSASSNASSAPAA